MDPKNYTKLIEAYDRIVKSERFLQIDLKAGFTDKVKKQRAELQKSVESYARIRANAEPESVLWFFCTL